MKNQNKELEANQSNKEIEKIIIEQIETYLNKNDFKWDSFGDVVKEITDTLNQLVNQNDISVPAGGNFLATHRGRIWTNKYQTSYGGEYKSDKNFYFPIMVGSNVNLNNDDLLYKLNLFVKNIVYNNPTYTLNKNPISFGNSYGSAYSTFGLSDNGINYEKVYSLRELLEKIQKQKLYQDINKLRLFFYKEKDLLKKINLKYDSWIGMEANPLFLFLETDLMVNPNFEIPSINLMKNEIINCLYAYKDGEIDVENELDEKVSQILEEITEDLEDTITKKFHNKDVFIKEYLNFLIENKISFGDIPDIVERLFYNNGVDVADRLYDYLENPKEEVEHNEIGLLNQ